MNGVKRHKQEGETPLLMYLELASFGMTVYAATIFLTLSGFAWYTHDLYMKN